MKIEIPIYLAVELAESYKTNHKRYPKNDEELIKMWEHAWYVYTHNEEWTLRNPNVNHCPHCGKVENK